MPLNFMYLVKWTILALLYYAFLTPHFAKFIERHTRREIFSKDKPNFLMKDSPAKVIVCNDSTDLFQIRYVTLNPNPPQKGENLTITVAGSLSEDIVNGSYMLANLKKGSFNFPQFRVQVCDYFNGGCPVRKGNDSIISMTFEIPKLMPSGDYKVRTRLFKKGSLDNLGKKQLKLLTNVINKEPILSVQDERILCLQGEIQL